MFRVVPADQSGSLLFQPRTPSRIAAGLFSCAFALVMLLHPDGWKTGTLRDGIVQLADPNLIRAIGVAIFVFGFLCLCLRVTYLVNRSAGSLTKQLRLVVPVRSTQYRLSDFSKVTIDSSPENGGRILHRLCLVGPAHSLCLASSRDGKVLIKSRKIVRDATGIRA